MSVRTPARARSWRHRIGTALVGLVAAVGIAIVPASPAHAVQTIAWTTQPPSTANLGDTVSFAWAGAANTFLGARITGCFANFSDGNNYVNQFQGNFTTGNCNYTNRVVTSSPTYSIVVGFTLSTGGQMTMSWNVSVANPTPTLVNVPAQVNLATTVAGGAVMPALSVYATDSLYGNYSATCTPAAGTVIAYPGTTGTCSATNPAGRTATANFPINVAKGTPTVSWNLPSTVNYGTTYGSLQTATVTPNNLTGNWVYTNAQGATVNPSAVIPVGSGQVVGATFVPSGASATSWSTSPTALRSISVLQAPQTVAFAAGTPTSKTYGDEPFQVSAAGTTGGGQVAITSQPGSSCTVGSPGGTTAVTATVTLTGAGGCVLLASQAASGQYAAAPTASWSVTVAKRNTTTTWSAPGSLTYGQTLASVLNASSSASGTIVYRNQAGAVLNGSTVLDAGTHNVTATFTPTDPANYLGSSVSQSLVVDKAAADLSVPALGDTTYGVAPLSLGATSASPAPISVVASGACSAVGQQVTVLTAGTCSLTISQAATPNYDGASVARSFEVAKAAVDLVWSDPAPITYGTAFDPDLMGAAVAGANPPAGFLAYALVNGDDATGAVLRAGDHDVIATWTPIAADASRYQVATRTATIHVDKATPTITWADPADIPFLTVLGDTQLDATVAGVAGTIAYTLENGDDARGAALRAGTHTLTATFTPDSVDYRTVSTTVAVTVTRLAQEITWDVAGTHTLGDGPFALTATGGGSGNPVTFATDSGACSVDGDVVTILHAGDCTVTASQAGADDYWAAEPSSRSMTVAKAFPTLTWDEPAGITYGDALGGDELDAVVSPAGATGTIAYTLANGDPADGAVLHAGDDQFLIATFVPDEASAGDYYGATLGVTLDVAKAGQAIAFAELADATYGDGPVALDATGGDSGAPVTFTAAGPCSLDHGSVRIEGAGTCQVTADQAGDADHEAAASATRSFAIAKAAQHVVLAPVADRTWGAPAFVAGTTPGASDAPVLLSADGACSVWDTTVTLVGTGACTLTATQGGDLNHLAAEPVSRTFSIDKAGLTVAALPATKAYGAGNPGLGYTIDGFVAGDTESALSALPTCTTAATVGTHVGTAQITCSGAEAANYAITYTAADLTVSQAPLTLVGPVATKSVGTSNPALEPSFTGFVNGDGVAALDSTGACATTATTSSPVGVYPVTCSGASARDYDITSLPGSLTVTPGYSMSAFQGGVVDGLVVKKGSTLPMKFTLLDGQGAPVSSSELRQIADAGRVTIATRSSSGGPWTQQGAFKLTGGTLHLNLATGGLALGSNEVVVTVKAADASVLATRSFTLVVR